MASAFKIEYRLVGLGWANVLFTRGEWRSETLVSYLSEPLWNLAWGTLGLFDDRVVEDLQNIFFDAEGGGIRLWAAPKEGEESKLLVRFFDPSPDLPNPPSELPYEFSIDTHEFASSILDALESIYDAYGILEYHEQWRGSDFPVAAMVRLRCELGLSSAERPLW